MAEGVQPLQQVVRPCMEGRWVPRNCFGKHLNWHRWWFVWLIWHWHGLNTGQVLRVVVFLVSLINIVIHTIHKNWTDFLKVDTHHTHSRKDICSYELTFWKENNFLRTRNLWMDCRLDYWHRCFVMFLLHTSCGSRTSHWFPYLSYSLSARFSEAFI